MLNFRMEESRGIQGQSNVLAYNGRAESMDTADTHMNVQRGSSKASGAPLPPAAHYQQGHYGYAPPAYASGTRNPIKTCVTTSFEEREDRMMDRRDPAASYHAYSGARREGSQMYSHPPPHLGNGREEFHRMEPPSHHYYMEREPYQGGREGFMYSPRELPPIREASLAERQPPPHEMMRPPTREIRLPQSPRPESSSYIDRSFSNTSSIGSSYRGGPLKRSFWHHARYNGEDYQQQTLPNEFMPPKRNKVTPSSDTKHREYVMTARTPSYAEDTEREAPPPPRSPGWFNRVMSWEASRDDYYQREQVGRVYTGSWSSRSPPTNFHRDDRNGGHWGDAPSMPSPPDRFISQMESGYEIAPNQMGRWHPSDERTWNIQSREEMGVVMQRDGGVMHRQGTFESSSPNVEPPMRFVSATTPRGMEHGIFMNEMMPMPSPGHKNTGILLLALPEDRISLSETLCLVREVRRTVAPSIVSTCHIRLTHHCLYAEC